MNSTRRAQRAEQNENAKVLDGVLAALNLLNTSVIAEGDRYIVMNGDDKVYEVITSPEPMIIRGFSAGRPKGMRVIEKEGLRVRAKLWLLKFKLEDAVSVSPLEKLSEKMKSTNTSVSFVNEIMTILARRDTHVVLEHETLVMQKYKITYVTPCGAQCEMVVEFNGSVVRFNDDGCKFDLNAEGYIGWKLNSLHRELKNKVQPRASMMARLTERLKSRQYQ